jgi:ketosteroid isomerase-like protein
VSRQVVERYLSALAAQDWPALAACLAPDVERIGPFGDVYRGREPYVSFLADTLRALKGYELAVERLIVASDAVVAELHETMDTPDGRRRTHEAVVFDTTETHLITRVAVYLRRAVILGR